MADISHISGLVIAGAHPSPVDYAHFTTTSTYKPGGPRGGLIVMGRDFDMPVQVGKKAVPLWERIEKTTFPGFQGTPYLNNIAAKAVFFKETLSPSTGPGSSGSSRTPRPSRSSSTTSATTSSPAERTTTCSWPTWPTSARA